MVKRDEIFKSDKLGKILSPAQKVIIFGALIAAILVFVYSFIYMTPFSDLYQIDGPFLFQKMAPFGIDKELIDSFGFPKEAYYFSPFFESEDPVGVNLAFFTSFTRHELQVTNHWLFAFGFFGLIASIIPLVYFSQKRKIYYKTNLVTIPVVAGFNLYIGVHMLIQLILNQMLVLSKTNEYILVNAYQSYLNGETTLHEYFHTTDSIPIFVIGYVIAAAVIIFAISSVLLTIVKYKHQKNQKQVDLSKVVIHE